MVALLQIVAIWLVDNPRVDIYVNRVANMYGYKKNSTYNTYMYYTYICRHTYNMCIHTYILCTE